MSHVIAIAGRIGSGKSTASQALARALECPCASFGDYVRAIADQRGGGAERRKLQEIGEDLVAGGWKQFVEAVVCASGWRHPMNLVIDGVRHEEALQHIKEFVDPTPLVFVFIDVSDAERDKRLDERQTVGVEVDRSRPVERHSTERQVPALKSSADLIVSADQTIDRVVAEIRAFLEP